MTKLAPHTRMREMVLMRENQSPRLTNLIKALLISAMVGVHQATAASSKQCRNNPRR